MTYLGEKAFYLNQGGLVTVHYENTKKLATIGDQPFNDPKYATKVISFSSSLTSIGSHAFYFDYNNLEYDPNKEDYMINKIKFDQNTKLNSIGSNAFAYQYDLEITEKIVAHEIRSNAFRECYKINCPITITKVSNEGGKIESYAFYKFGYSLDPSQTEIKITCTIEKPDDVKGQETQLPVIKTYAFYQSGIKEINLPHMKSIDENAFQYCYHLAGSQQSLEVDEIKESAFDSDNILTFPTIISKNIHNYAFKNCHNLAPSTITILQTDHFGGTIGKKAFLNCQSLESTLIINEPDEPKDDVDDVKHYSTIDNDAFKNSGIKTLNLPKIMKSIGTSAFENCVLLTGTSDGNLNINNIQLKTFKGDKNLKLTKITANQISSEAFHQCYELGADIEIIDKKDDVYETLIGPNAFEDCRKLGKLTIDISYTELTNKPSLRTIDEKAFYNSGLNGKLTIPFSVYDLGPNSFSYCRSLETVEFESHSLIQQEIQEEAFLHSGIKGTLTIPSSVVTVGESAFSNTGITELIIEGSAFTTTESGEIKGINTEIQDKAFYNCKSLATLTFKDGFINLDQKNKNNEPIVCKTFQGCPINKLELGKIKIIPKEAFYGIRTLPQTIKIPETVTDIRERAFAECPNIKNVNFEENSQLTNINEAAFYKCSALSSVSIPFGVERINPYTFYKCTSLEKLELQDSVEDIDDYAFYGCTNLKKPLDMPKRLKTIGKSAFQDCTSLDISLTLPDTLTTVNDKAFFGCGKLQGDLTFGRSIETIGKFAFRDCGFNGNLNFPDFYYDENGRGLTIKEGAFYGCSSFKGDLTLPQKKDSNEDLVPVLSNDVFHGCSGFDGQLNLPNKIETINQGTFYGCSLLNGDISLMKLKSVGQYAFYDCPHLTGTLNLEDLSDPTINKYAFYNCQGLNSLILKPEKTYTVKEHAFDGCSGLEGTLDGCKFSKIEKYGFARCSGLTGPLNFDDKTKEIQEHAFVDCTGFSDQLSFVLDSNEAPLPDNTLKIGYRAFKGCTGFKNGRLSFITNTNEETNSNNNDNIAAFYRFNYFLKIENEAFEDTKFKNIYYMGRFEPDCDYDIGISKTKGIHTSSNYANKTFCNYPLHSNKLSGGAIAGIVIACIVVVAAIAVLIVWLIIRNKRNKDQSEAEVEMNQDP